MLNAAREGQVSEYMRLGLYEDYEELEHPSPTLRSHMLSQVSSGLSGTVISLSAGGQTSTRCSDIVTQAVKRALDDGLTQTAGKGSKAFRQLLAAKLARDNGIEVDADTELQPTIGSQLALFGVVHILVRPGDEVLIIDPEYAAFEPIVRMVGARAVRVPLCERATEWEFDLAEVESRITGRTRLLFFSNGNNPTGVVYSAKQLEEIARLAQKHNFYVLSDEEYEKIVFEGQHTSIGSLSGMKERTITTFSYSKTYSMSGFRIGYMAAPAWIIDYMQDIIRVTVQSIPSLGQAGAQALLANDHSTWLATTLEGLRRKRDIGVQMLNAMPGVTCTVPHGCYFLFPDIRGVGLSTWEFTVRLLQEEHVNVSPGFNFGPTGEGHVRVSACVGEDQMVEGLNRMARFTQRVAAERGSRE